jgi:hypothetical protein
MPIKGQIRVLDEQTCQQMNQSVACAMFVWTALNLLLKLTRYDGSTDRIGDSVFGVAASETIPAVYADFISLHNVNRLVSYSVVSRREYRPLLPHCQP